MIDSSEIQIDLPALFNTQLLALSHRYGADPAFVLAGGGNTSAKRGDRLWVKASGHALATIGNDGFVELDRTQLEGMLAAEWPGDPKVREALFIQRVMAARISPELGQRPSVESLLHHLLPHPLVVHTHPGSVNAVTCYVQGRQIAEELFGDDVLWLNYVDPGLMLAQSLQTGLARYRAGHSGQTPSAILLQNHGLIVGGDSMDSIARTTNRIVESIHDRIELSPSDATVAPLDQSLLQTHAAAIVNCHPGLHVTTDTSDSIGWLVQNEGGKTAAQGGPLIPDQIVYCRSLPVVIDEPSTDPQGATQQWSDAWLAYEEAHGFAPWVGLVAGAGLLAFRESAKMADVTRCVYVDAVSVCRNAARLGGIHPLDARDRKFIEEWEVESHRRSVMSKSV